MNIEIRHAKIEDAHSIAEAERQIAQAPGFFCSSPSELTDENVAKTILSFLKDNTGVYFVAEYKDQLVGHAFLEPYVLKSLSHVADLNIAVHLGWQGKGIGRKLLEQIIEWAKNSPVIEKIELKVRASNTAAILLYKKMGFQEEGRLKNRVKVNGYYMDDILMSLDLKKDTSKNLLERAPILTTFAISPASKTELEAIEDAITSFNVTIASDLPRATLHRLDFSAKNQKGELLGCIQAKRVNWGILEIELLFVFEKYRHQGIASQLLQHVEHIARDHQCHIAHLDTFDFQAKDFYLRQGYSIFGTLENTPKGHCRYYMKKDLERNVSHEILIREVKASDIEVLTEAFCFPWTTKLQTVEKWSRYFSEHEQRKRTVYVLEKQGQIIGYASLLYLPEYSHFQIANIPEINDVWIQEDFRSRGFGKMLIQHLEEMARRQGYKQIGLGVGLYKDYGSAQALYYKLGYVPDGNGVTYKTVAVVPGQQFPMDDDLLLWLVKSL